jgi:hypothetical protein
MFSLTNDSLEVQLLDPAADRARFGVRYCTGGYIFQIRDNVHGDMLSGPTFPDSFNWFDGQGIPDAFNLGPLNSNKTLGEALIIGIGVCDTQARTVKSFSDWHVTRSADSAAFETRQTYEDFSLTLARTVSLHERTVRSHTTLANVGKAPVPMRWFPHPFYPQTATDELLWINAPLTWRDANGYTRLPNGFIARTDWPWKDGHYQPLDHDATAPLILLQRHPTLGLVSAACSYVPDYFPIWGNAATFSWEPFLERSVFPGQSYSWWIDYSF